MHLVDHIKTDRVRKKGKQPLPETVFAVVAGIIKKFNLETVPAGGGFGVFHPEIRPPARLSLFPLLTAAQWQLCQEIIDTCNNPYLIYARSPEDVRLSRFLYQRNPDLAPETLRQYSLGFLLNREAQQELR